MRRQLGHAFTLVELVIVIAILGILAAIAIPRFIDIRSQAHTASRDGIIGSVRAGILTTASKNQVAGGSSTFPPELETDWTVAEGGSAGLTGGILEGSAKACNTGTGGNPSPCFELVIPGGYIDTNWQQNDATGTVYKFTHPITSTETKTCTYSTTNGTFACI